MGPAAVHAAALFCLQASQHFEAPLCSLRNNREPV